MDECAGAGSVGQIQWFQFQAGPRTQTLTFQPGPDRFWAPRILATNPLPDFDPDKPLRISGAAAVWMYAHTAAHAALSGVAQIDTESAAPKGTATDVTDCKVVPTIDPANASRGMIEIDLRTVPALADQVLDSITKPAVDWLRSHPLRQLILTGRAPVATYARLAAEAIRTGVEDLQVFTPRTGLIQVAAGANTAVPVGAILPIAPNDALGARLILETPGLVIGVVGDPNVGKSLFSSILDQYRDTCGVPGWRLDCDGQSPTPPWFLQGQSQAEGRAESMAQRKELKRSWSSEMETVIASQLDSLKRSLPITIADLPGGDHRSQPAQRIPPGRGRLFTPIDRLIILQSASQPSASAWISALDAIGAADKVVAVVTTSAPEAATRMYVETPALETPASVARMPGECDFILQARISGLNRTYSIAEMLRACENPLSAFWQHITDHSQVQDARK